MQHSDDTWFAPSFNSYSTDNPTSIAAAKVSREFSDIEEEDFEFSLEFSGEKFSIKDLAFEGRILVPIFNTDLATKDEIDHDDVIPLENLLASDSEETDTYSSSSEASEMEDTGTFRVTWGKSEPRSPGPGQVKKSRSTGSEESESRRWKIKDIFRRSNSSGEETMFFLCPKRFEALCKKGLVKPGGASSKAAGKVKTASSPSVHELFYVQKRAERNGGKVKSYLPYRQEILGFKVHIKGNANKKLPF
ncbi:hypothetical protein HanRHA438_Chr09g0414881 [Helianthus annuus]|uniref:Uncharacterized protein n=1 Tax=Helianthus annuus TaxID=4232 RepID=A0A9K3I8V5_HELAN|nr:uncharacterized protein LOC110876639 [Helianthus annuus]KAF5792165.1 hypothetical protein HanXRQr2_Chr09g0402961 [Helianthus annuus]KAJ0527136.1 hypothetical protein HanHA300_Chr09g0330811 [Helianthus annuus]KAJ0535768.1 hypothetical protein HanIR_Chr09g0434221 [Helianthus annuus]KAJ0543537.1 hypothetical protein HanHA89_Chr09g0351781 [Helianthus annuus]KAJ0708590.1 hypothetical protein HanLR1_Chr09g0331081 [Helianthus annuus]